MVYFQKIAYVFTTFCTSFPYYCISFSKTQFRNLMTKYNKIIIAVFLLGLSAISCKKLTELNPKTDTTTTNNTAANPNAEVNSWIYDELKTYYLWESQMVEKTKTDNKLEAKKYFESILVDAGNLDRFSWIQDDVAALTASLNGVNKVLGVRTSAIGANADQSKVALAIIYALKGSPAEKAGLKRGDFILQVDGKDLTPSNYSTALSNESLKLGLGEYKNGLIVSNGKEISVVKEEVQTNPIQHYSIIEKGNKKIGYLVYLQFLTQFDNDFRAVFKEFKDKGVNELVLDLRFNGGGYISSSNIISSLIVKNLTPGSLMARQEWNAQLTTAYKNQYGNGVFDTQWLNEANNLKTLNRVYVLTSGGTASASELVINNLKPYMDVILIGGNTYGKNVGSITLSDDKKRWAYGMQPIVLRTVNSQGKSDYGTKDGFTPDFKVVDNVIPYFQFGDERETLLKVAIEKITGQAVATNNPNGRVSISTKANLLDNNYALDNPKYEVRDMFIDKLPGQK